MSASVIAYWTGITEGQLESQPGFYNDCNAWGNWMAEREESPETLKAIKKLNAEAIQTFITNGLSDDDVEWVTPKELREAAIRLREAIEAGRPETKAILESYQRNANGLDSLADEFIQDLNDIEAIANWAEEEGTNRMTLEVNW